MSEQSDEWEAKCKELYAKYLEHCKKDNVALPAPYVMFRRRVQEKMANMIAETRAQRFEDFSDVYYVASRVEDGGRPVSGSVTRQCSQCQKDVYVAMPERADKSKGIMCNHCIEELTGKPFNQIVKEDLDDL
jgi:DNA-directed RNA polymerase subunit RPC12/RpoP